MMRELVLQELLGGLWHTTHPDRFTKILESGGISTEPDIPEKERWGTRDGRESYSYVRFIGGVSLFDLHEFERESYSDKFPSSSWHYFIPFHLMWGCAVWIEINRDQAASHLISPIELKNRTDGILKRHIATERCRGLKRHIWMCSREQPSSGLSWYVRKTSSFTRLKFDCDGKLLAENWVSMKLSPTFCLKANCST